MNLNYIHVVISCQILLLKLLKTQIKRSGHVDVNSISRVALFAQYMYMYHFVYNFAS